MQAFLLVFIHSSRRLEYFLCIFLQPVQRRMKSLTVTMAMALTHHHASFMEREREK